MAAVSCLMPFLYPQSVQRYDSGNRLDRILCFNFMITVKIAQQGMCINATSKYLQGNRNLFQLKISRSCSSVRISSSNNPKSILYRRNLIQKQAQNYNEVSDYLFSNLLLSFMNKLVLSFNKICAIQRSVANQKDLATTYCVMKKKLQERRTLKKCAQLLKKKNTQSCIGQGTKFRCLCLDST